MKLSNWDIFNAAKPLEVLSKKEWPVKTSYQIIVLMKKLSGQLEVIEKIRINLIQKYGTKDEKTGGMIVPEDSENWKKFMSELNEIMRQEIDIEIEKIELPNQVDGKTIQIEPSALFLIDKFITII